MPGDDYKSATGGSLKLKGVQSGKITKSKKKKKDRTAAEGSEKPESSKVYDDELKEESREKHDDVEPEQRDPESRKTESERQHEEHKRKQLHERLKREGGAKTHKERVEDLNRYLSRLSEHHDMPKIGPG